MLEHAHVGQRLGVVFDGLFVQHRPAPHFTVHVGVAGGHPEHVFEVAQQCGRRTRVLCVGEVVGNADAQRHRRHARTVEAFLHDADDAGRPLVLRLLQAETTGEVGVRGAADYGWEPRVRYLVGKCTERDDCRTLETLCDFDQRIDEGRPVDVWLDAGQQHEIAVALGETCDVDVVLGPTNLPFVVVIEVDLGAFLREIEERIRVDAGDNGDDTVAHAPLQRRRRRTGHVEPAAQCDEKDRIAQRCEFIPTGGENVGRLHTLNSTSVGRVTHPGVRPRSRCTA